MMILPVTPSVDLSSLVALLTASISDVPPNMRRMDFQNKRKICFCQLVGSRAFVLYAHSCLRKFIRFIPS